jgi:hypothetical protein
MIQVALRNKYSFNMQVSARAMAVAGGRHGPENELKTPAIGPTEGFGPNASRQLHVNVFWPMHLPLFASPGE